MAPNRRSKHSALQSPRGPPQTLESTPTASNDLPDQVDQTRQGEYYDCLTRDRIDIYKLVDSWRSYRNDTGNLLTSAVPQPTQSARPPSQHTRSVHHYTRYPTYRVDKPYRILNGVRERQTAQHRQNALQTVPAPSASRFAFRRRQSDQLSGSSPASVDIPLPSVETQEDSAHFASLKLPPIRKFESRRSRSAIPSSVESLPPPKATANYKRQAAWVPARREAPQKLLVVLDLNGTLLVRPNRRKDPKKFIIRPGVEQLLKYLFQNHVVMVYSSAKPENTAAMVAKLIPRTQRQEMAGIWARDKLDLTKKQYDNKVQVYKKLEKIWDDKSIQAKAEPGRIWDQSNTVLVDDSQVKALAQPHNLLQVPEFENDSPRQGGEALLDWQRKEMEIVRSLEQKLEELKWQVDVSRLIREWQAGTTEAPGIVDETVDQKTQRTLKLQEPTPRQTDLGSNTALSVGQAEVPLSQQYLTPTSSSSDSDVDDQGVDIYSASVLGELENEIDRSMQKTTIRDVRRRSESSIDESVWPEILAGGKGKDSHKGEGERDEDKNRGSLIDVPPTPESMCP